MYWIITVVYLQQHFNWLACGVRQETRPAVGTGVAMASARGEEAASSSLPLHRRQLALGRVTLSLPGVLIQTKSQPPSKTKQKSLILKPGQFLDCCMQVFVFAELSAAALLWTARPRNQPPRVHTFYKYQQIKWVTLWKKVLSAPTCSLCSLRISIFLLGYKGRERDLLALRPKERAAGPERGLCVLLG